MGVDITSETITFLSTVVCGIICGILYDIFKVLFNDGRKNKIIVSVFDIFLSFFIGIFIIFVFYFYNSFLIRWYMIIGLIVGVILYFLCFSTFIIKILEKILKIFEFILKILLTPARFLYRILLIRVIDTVKKFFYKIYFNIKNTEKICKINRGKKMKKNVKKRVKTKKIRFSVALLVTAVIFMLVKGILLQPDIVKNKDKISELEAKISYEQQRAEEIDKLKENVESDEYIEKIAREKLGMIRKDEIVFIDITGEE